jgi:hypothetical protein
VCDGKPCPRAPRERITLDRYGVPSRGFDAGDRRVSSHEEQAPVKESNAHRPPGGMDEGEGGGSARAAPRFFSARETIRAKHASRNCSQHVPLSSRLCPRSSVRNHTPSTPSGPSVRTPCENKQPVLPRDGTTSEKLLTYRPSHISRFSRPKNPSCPFPIPGSSLAPASLLLSPFLFHHPSFLIPPPPSPLQPTPKA